MNQFMEEQICCLCVSSCSTWMFSQVSAELREKERELQETVSLLRSVTVERDQALRAARLVTNTVPQVRPQKGITKA